MLAPLEAQVRRATTDQERTRAQAEVGAAKWMYGAIEHVTLAYPTQLVPASPSPTRIDLGGLAVVIEPHHGHTPGDLTIAVPDRNVMFVGDLLFYREYPVAIDADMVAWREMLGVLSRVSRSMRLIPGHGPVCDRDAVLAQIDLFDDLRRHAERMQATGAPETEATASYTIPAAFRDYDVFAWSWTIGAAMRSYYRARR